VDIDLDAELMTRALMTGGLATISCVLGVGQEALDYLFRTGAYAGARDSCRGWCFLPEVAQVDGMEVLEGGERQREDHAHPGIRFCDDLVAGGRDVARTYDIGE
jgi:hypothetical protein